MPLEGIKCVNFAPVVKFQNCSLKRNASIKASEMSPQVCLEKLWCRNAVCSFGNTPIFKHTPVLVYAVLEQAVINN